MSTHTSHNRESELSDRGHSAQLNPTALAGSSATTAATPVRLPSTSEFALFDQNFDLNQQPPNYFRQRSNLEKLVFQASRESTEKPDPQYSIHLASKFPKLVGNVDVISSSRNVKTLLKMAYAPPGSHVSIMVHRLGNSLLLDEFDLFAFMLRQDFESWEWLRHFAATNNMAVRPSGRNQHDVSSKRLLTKFLYHTASISDMPSAGLTPVQPKPLVPAAPDPNSDDPLKCMVWNFENLRMLLGTNLPIFGGPKHPCISVRLRDSSKPISVLTGIDYWLDNMINEVPELAMCYHANGLFKGCDIFSTDSIPRMADFDPDAVREIARSLVWFLKAKATKEGHTYWLFKAPNSDIVKLYDLTSLCQSDSDSQPHQQQKEPSGTFQQQRQQHKQQQQQQHQQQQQQQKESDKTESSVAESQQAASSSPFAAPVGMLCYRVARSCFVNAGGTSGLSDQERMRLRRLLTCSLQLLDRSKHSPALAGCNLLLAELLLGGAEGQERSQQQLQHGGRSGHSRRSSNQRGNRSHSRSLVQHQQQPDILPRLILQQQQHQDGPANSSIDLRQLMASLASTVSATTTGTLVRGEVEADDESEDILEQATTDGDSQADDNVEASPFSSLRHALDAVRLLLLDAEATASGSPATCLMTADLARALPAVARACLQLPEDSTAMILLTAFRVAAGALLLLLTLMQSQTVTDGDGFDVMILGKAANCMMVAYQSSSAGTPPASAADVSKTSSLRQDDHQLAGDVRLLGETDRLIDSQLDGIIHSTGAHHHQAQKRVNSIAEHLQALRSALPTTEMATFVANADYLAVVVRIYRFLCDFNSGCGVPGVSRRQLRERLAAATNEWALRTLVEVKHAMTVAEEAAAPIEATTKAMERQLETALETLKQVQHQNQHQGQLPTDQAVYLLANQALVLRAINECRHTLPRRRQSSTDSAASAVTWAEIKLHDSAMQAYQAAIDRLGSRQLETASLWDNMAWHRLMTLVDKIVAVSTAPVEGLSEEERCKELIRLERQALAMCDTQIEGEKRNSFRYQAAQAHKTLADLMMRACLEGWSKVKSESECRAKWMSGYDSCIRLLLSIRGDPQLRNPRMCLEAIGKLAKFQMDRADEERRRRTASGDILQPGGDFRGRYSEELALLRILAVARHPLDELAAAGESGRDDWPTLHSVVRVLSLEALDSAKGLLQLAKILRDDGQLAEAKSLYSQLLQMLKQPAASTNSSSSSSSSSSSLSVVEQAEILESARRGFHSLGDWCHRQLGKYEFSSIFEEPVAEAIN